MVATPQRTLNNVLIRKDKHRILPSSVLYGANASGKSNVIYAMTMLCWIVESGTVSHSANLMNPIMFFLELFPFIHDDNTDPISFEIEFIADSDHFIYHLSIGVEALKQNGKRHIVNETLEKVLSGEKINLFRRTKDNIVVGDNETARKILDYDDESMLQVLVDSAVQNMDGQTLFLTGGFKSTIRKPVADKVIEYFSNKVVAIDGSADMLSKDKMLVMKELDLDLYEEIFIDNELFDNIIKAADFGPQQISWRKKKKDSQGYNKLELVSRYRDNIILSDLMESAGTIKLLRFAVMLKHFIDEGGILMIDELDTAIHPEIMKSILALFGNPDVNKKGAQLVFTSHNPIFMDKDLLRRDQIIFVEKDPDTYCSTLHSLGDFGSVKVRNDQSFMRNYVKGRYGRLPYIDLESVLAHRTED
jgi:hypothetical protein